MYYLSLYIILFSLAILDFYLDNIRLRKIFYVVFYLLFVFTAGLKFETGVDWRAYSEMVTDTEPLQRIGSNDWEESVFGQLDIGFFFLISLIRTFGGELQTLFFIISAVSSLFLLSAFYRVNPRYGLFGALLYYCMVFFYLDMSGIRQAMALCTVFYGVSYLLHNKYLSFVFIGILGSLFHWSAFVLMIVCFLSKFRFNKILLGVFLIGGLLIFLFEINLINIFLPIVGSFLLSGNFSEKLILYTSTELFAGDRGFSARLIIHLFLTVAFIIIYFVVIKNDKYKNHKYLFLFRNVLVVQLFSTLLLYSLPEISERLKLYFYISNMVLIPSLLIFLKHPILKSAYVLFIGMYAFFYGNIFLLEKSIAISYVPYQNFLIYKMLDKKSTGETRLEDHIYELDAK